MSVVTFEVGLHNLPACRIQDEKYRALSQWLTADVSRYFATALDALAMADDVANGREPFEEWSSENYEIAFTPETFRVANLWVPETKGEYPMDVVRSTLEDLWTFLASRPERNVVREYRPDLSGVGGECPAVGNTMGTAASVPAAVVLIGEKLEREPAMSLISSTPDESRMPIASTKGLQGRPIVLRNECS